MTKICEDIWFYPLHELGHGSEAVVYEGRYGRFNQKEIAVKVVKCADDNEAKETHTEIERIYREIKAMETLNKPSRCPYIIDFIRSYIR